jgi:hypothetical protein
MKITEVEGIPSDLLKGDTLPLYKAFIFAKPGKEMKVNESAEFMALSPEAAVNQLLQEIPVDEFNKVLNKEIFGIDDPECYAGENAFSTTVTRLFGNFGKNIGMDSEDRQHLYDNLSVEYNKKTGYKITVSNAVVNFAVFNMNLEDLKEKDLVDGGTDYFRDGVIGITLKDKLYDLDVSEMALLSFHLVVNEETGNRSISHIKLKDVNKK